MPAISWTVSLILIASVAGVSIAAWMSKGLKRAFILNAYKVREKYEIHRLLTAGWLHGDTTHLLFNMLTLYFFADEVIKALGPTRFLILYVSTVVIGFIPSTLRHMYNPQYNSLGASGAVAAVMFSAVLLYPQMKLSLMFIPIPMPAVWYAVAYLAYNAYTAYRSSDGVNHEAHFAGAVAGAGLTYFFEPARVSKTLSHFF